MNHFERMDKEVIAVIRVRGRRNMKPKIAHTLELLKLSRTNHAVVYKATMSIIGMLKVVKDYVAFGRISKDMLEALELGVVLLIPLVAAVVLAQ